MSVHDWTKVDAGIFHDFHNEWLTSIKHALNHKVLPKGYYAAVEQVAGGFVSDVLTLESGKRRSSEHRGNGTTVLTKPRQQPTAEAEIVYGRRRKVIAVHHVSNREVVAIVEIVSPRNKKGKDAFAAFVEKVGALLSQQIHVLVVDLFPPSRRDPDGIHGAIWDDLSGDSYRLPKRKQLTLASYEADAIVRAYVEHFAVGDKLSDMPLFLEPDGCVNVPLEATYVTAFTEVPEEWRELVT